VLRWQGPQLCILRPHSSEAHVIMFAVYWFKCQAILLSVPSHRGTTAGGSPLLVLPGADNLISVAQRCSVTSACWTREVFAIMLSLPLCNMQHLHAVTNDMFPTFTNNVCVYWRKIGFSSSLQYEATLLSCQEHSLPDSLPIKFSQKQVVAIPTERPPLVGDVSIDFCG
jgi:hypothetical protein